MIIAVIIHGTAANSRLFTTFDSGTHIYPDSKVQGANIAPTWVLSAPDGLHVGPMILAIRVITKYLALLAAIKYRNT